LIFIFYCIITNISIADSKNFLVTTSHSLATQTGKNILLDGGNAIDAAVAVQLVLNVVEPQSSGIGGGGFLLYYNKKNEELIFFDGREIAPSKIKKEYFLDKNGKPLSFYEAAVGGLSVGVPGLLSMLESAHKEFGSIKWKDLFKPAIYFSSEGFPISQRLHNQINKDKYLYLIPESYEYFYEKTNVAKKKGFILKNKEFSETLKIIANKGSKGFYEGDVAKKITSSLHNSPIRKGVMNLKDLKNYKSIKTFPLCGNYRNYKICSAPLPSAGGFSILQILGILENFPLSRNTINSDIRLIIEASKYAYLDRYKYLGDPNFNKINLKEFLSKEYLRNKALKISNNLGKSKDLKDLNIEKNKLNISKSTTHFSIHDKYGNIVAMTSSIENAFGSRLMAGGFLLNNQLSDFNILEKNNLYKNNIIKPNKKPLSSMSPTIIFDENNNIKMVIGSPGGKSIIMYVLKTIIAVLDWGMSIEEAVNFPNFSLKNNIVLLESNRSNKELEKYLIKLGYSIEKSRLNSGLNGFEIKNHIIKGVADKRRQGLFLTN